MQEVCASFVQKCEAAGMTTSPDWQPPPDKTELEHIVRHHSLLIRHFSTNLYSNFETHAMQPLVWHVFVKLKKQGHETK